MERENLERALEEVEIVYHQAALTSVTRNVTRPLDTNVAFVTATVNLLNAARQAGVRRVIYSSLSSVYDDRPNMSKRKPD